MADDNRQRKVTRTAILLGLFAVAIYVGYILLYVNSGGGGAGS